MKESGRHIPYATKFSLCDFSIITFITFMFRCVHVCVCAHLHTSKLAATGKLWVRKKCPSHLLPTFRNQINVNIFWKLPLQYIFEKKKKNKPVLFSHHAFSALSWPASVLYLWHLVAGKERHSTSCYIVPLIMRDGDYSAT